MALSPMMQKYLETKNEYRDCILFYRLGDFYELFFEDAETGSKELGLTLTGKDCGLSERAPMCGVPYHAVDTYLSALVEKGYKVAVAEQMEDPKLAKGIVKREVIRVVTPGTILDTNALDETKNNYIMSIVYERMVFGIAVCDVTTGSFCVYEAENKEELYDSITDYSPSEILVTERFSFSGADLSLLSARNRFSVTKLTNNGSREKLNRQFLKHFEVASCEALGLLCYPVGTLAAEDLLNYLLETQKTELKHINTVSIRQKGRYMLLDMSTRRNLELTETMRDKKKTGTLLWVLDHTKTAMGARTLRRMIEMPLLDKAEILKRQDAIQAFLNDAILREEIREYLNPVYDLERILSRISYKTANPRDLIAFKSSLSMLPHIKRLLNEAGSELNEELSAEIFPLEDLYTLIDKSIVDDPPFTLREGGIIKEGYSELVDNYRKSKTEGKAWISEIEETERNKTGIKNLRIKYNKVFGYYIEVTNSFKDNVPDYFIRKQTIANAERYITPRLKELEDLILGAEDKLYNLEFELFTKVREQIAEHIDEIKRTADALAKADALLSLAYIAERNNYIRPSINEKGKISISGGRHPVVEKMNSSSMFVPNDTGLDNEENRIAIITGPNMAGKSTYMRQTALITLMAQTGSFVPADSANICLCDRIFTRVGASDDLASGQSTFMVEMTEVANILRNATKKSLIILDEIGRGTSTFDGLAIAWAVVEYIANPKFIGAKTLFATHYHELTELEGALKGVKNYCITVREQGENIVFLRKIVKGGADKSYGIQVARLAGVPRTVLERASELVNELIDTDILTRAREIAAYSGKTLSEKKRITRPDTVDSNQLTFMETVKDEDVIKEIKDLDLTNMTPLSAINLLYRLQATLNNRV